MIELMRLKTNARRIYAFTRADNEIAHKFYDRVGFAKVAEIPDFYEDDEHNAYMFML